jgi:hypothetical protein
MSQNTKVLIARIVTSLYMIVNVLYIISGELFSISKIFYPAVLAFVVIGGITLVPLMKLREKKFATTVFILIVFDLLAAVFGMFSN